MLQIRRILHVCRYSLPAYTIFTKKKYSPHQKKSKFLLTEKNNNFFSPGFISHGDLAMALLEFLDDNSSFESTKAPKLRNIDATKDFERQVEGKK